jgi:hypothetical protein
MDDELHDLTNYLALAVADAARRGWTDTDLRRLLRRRLNARAAGLLDAVTAGGVAAWARRHRLSPVVALSEARLVLLLIRDVRQLPHIDAPAAGDVDPALLNKVRALLAKAESTGFPAEAEALSEKAHDLMQRHSIDRALLAGATPGHVQARRILIDDPYARARFVLLSGIARASGCRAVWWKAFGWGVVCGLPADLAATEMLYQSLLVQALSGLAAAPVDRRDPPARKAAFRRAFVVAFAHRVSERLRLLADARATEISHERGVDLLPVLASRQQAVKAAMAAISPNITTMSASTSDARGWAEGTLAGNRATIATQPTLPDLPGQLTA